MVVVGIEDTVADVVDVVDVVKVESSRDRRRDGMRDGSSRRGSVETDGDAALGS